MTQATKAASTEPDTNTKSKHITLHGQELGENMLLAGVAEALGTFILVLAIAGTAVAATLNRAIAGSPYDSLVVGLAGGAALLLLVASFGPISGAHFNPAVTIGLAANGRFPRAYVLAYVVSQFVGAIAAALIIWAMFGRPARDHAKLGASLPAPGVSVWRVLLAELIVTYILVIVIACVATDARLSRIGAGTAIGAALAIAILIAGPVSGAGVNPARAIGPMIVAGTFTDWWAYLIAPIVAGVLAVATYDRILRKTDVPS